MGRADRALARLDPPDEVREIVARLEREGFETWCVGGAVRDALLGHAHLDWDLATAATPAQVMRTFRRTVPVGVEFGTVGVIVSGNTMHEVTTFRRDVHTDGRHAVVEFGASLDEDLARRDFTINAIAYHPKQEELRDPFDGRGDLERGLVRAVGDPAARMREDRLRALRAIRFAARFGFHIDAPTWQAIADSASQLNRLSPERVKQELEKTMEQVERPSIALESWRASGALRELIPSIAEAPADWFLAIDLIDRTGPDTAGVTLNRLAMLFFGGREGVMSGAAKRLRFSNAEVAWIAGLCATREVLGEELDRAVWSAEPDALSDALIRRCVATAGRTRTHAFAALSVALWRARLMHDPNPSVDVRVATFPARAAAIAFRDPIELADLAVDGEDLRSAGIPAGPALGRILSALLDRVIADPAHNSREWLLAHARQLKDAAGGGA